jgi:hypothetical protein
MPKAKADQVVTHRIEFQEKERELLQAAIGANLAGKAVQAAGVASFAYVGYIGVKAAFGIVADPIADAVERFHENTILKKENREEWREQVENQSFQAKGSTMSQLEKTFHFWTGGIFV